MFCDQDKEQVRDEMGSVPINRILDLFEECRRTGRFAQCYLETRGAVVSATLSVTCDNGWGREEGGGQRQPRRRITPSRRRRNLDRRKAWLERKREEQVLPKPVLKDPAQTPQSDDCVEEIEIEKQSFEVEINPVWKVDNIPQLDGLPETIEHSADAEEFPEFSDETSVDPLDNDVDSEKELRSWRDFQSFCQNQLKNNKNEAMTTPNVRDLTTNNLFLNPG